MEATPLEFSFDMKEINRETLLEEAAQQLDLLRAVAGPGEEGRVQTPEGAAVRELKFDEAKLAAYPDVYRITDKDFLTRSRQIPVRFAQLTQDYNFYWLYLPIGLAPKRNWAFHMLEVKVEFNAGGAPHTRPRAYQILPARQFQTLLQANMGVEIRLNEGFEFEAKTGPLQGQIGEAGGTLNASVRTVAKAGAGTVLGPFSYNLKQAKIEHNSPGMEWIFWRLDGAEFFQETSPDLVVIAQVPKGTKEFHVTAQLQAYRYFNLGSAPLQQAVAYIAERFRNFFKAGLPLYDNKSYDLTQTL